MAAAGAIVGGVSSVSGILSKSKQARAQEAQIEAQRVGLRDQQTLNAIQIDEQRRQVNAAAERERLMGLQAQTLGMIQNDMQAKQQSIAAVQASIQNDQAAFLTSQKAAQKEAAANIAAQEQLKQLQTLATKGDATTQKLVGEGAQIAAQRMSAQGARAGDTQSGIALLERVLSAVGDGTSEVQSLFNGEMDNTQRQLLYETVTAGLEQQLGQQGVAQNAYNIDAGLRLNELQRAGNAQNINTQAARNTNARQYETASQNANMNLQLASNKSQTSAQLAGLNAQSQAISRPGFADILGAGANLGMSLYQSGVFSGGSGSGSATKTNAAPYSVFGGGGYNMSPFSGQATGILSGAGSDAFGFSTGKFY